MKAETVTSEVRPKIMSVLANSLLAGFWGYLLFLVILFLTKFVARYIQEPSVFEIEVADFVLPTIGFFLLFLIRFLEKFKEN